MKSFDSVTQWEHRKFPGRSGILFHDDGRDEKLVFTAIGCAPGHYQWLFSAVTHNDEELDDIVQVQMYENSREELREFFQHCLHILDLTPEMITGMNSPEVAK